ncbi:MAG: hypothetical protein A2428_09215 [Bdellovibrionales bacterium RIFOXYC1_FULL_54_43]|nr:MAG: hypothetical protein A2428_09215 [Bdellovibrionales bacterium RIFOXYC1_FULL_54_43]OFZ84819.1 MAG: hypothetical protein A2603_02850 [Bdellovibrionales bacterium RIFOXYD1_FULL_55_31]
MGQFGNFGGSSGSSGTSRDVLPSQVGWIHELARAEIHPDAERVLQLGRSFDPQQLVEESAIDFLTSLRECFAEYARILNAYAENGTRFQEIKVYSIAQTAADFMVFRNQIKLVFANSAHGVIQIAFAQHVRGTLAVDGQIQSSNNTVSSPALAQSQDLLAQVGPFRDVYWTFQGEKVEAEQVAKFYFAEFARITRDNKKSRAGNQILIEQIKALLQEKGLDL